MRQALEPTSSPAWVIRQDGFDPLRDGSRESRFAVSNGFLGPRCGRSVNAGAQRLVPPCIFVAWLFDCCAAEQPIPALVPVADWLQIRITLPEGPLIRSLSRAAAARRFFEGAAAIDLADTHAALDGGIHMAALGKVWLTAVFGFAGVLLRDDGLALDPQLPDRWCSLAFCVHWRGRRIRIAITQGGLAVSAAMDQGSQ